MPDRYAQISVTEDFIREIEKACAITGTSQLSFIKLSVLRMIGKDTEYRTKAAIALQIAESKHTGEKVGKSIRLKESFKAEVADRLAEAFAGNASLMYRASALSLATLPESEMALEVEEAFAVSVNKQYGIKLK